MKPTIVLVGRPNVGKSTLFNRLTKTRDAIVADIPGLTRDRHYGHGKIGSKPYLVVDTGGFEPIAKDGIMHEMARQTLQAIDEADVILFMVDVRTGCTAQDKVIADRLRMSGRPVHLVVNKTEGMRREVVTAEFHELALGEPMAISASHGEGVPELVEIALEHIPEATEETEDDHPKIALIGRPNVGKSTLVNSFLGEERVIAFDQPGTTRDSIYIDFERNHKKYTLIDTAGVRRRGKVFEAIEKFSVIKTLQAIEDANVVVLVLDAQTDISEQDAHLAGFVLEAGRALVVAVNKWDGLSDYQRDCVKREISRKLQFLEFAKFHYISALKGTGLNPLLVSVDAAYTAAMAKLSTPQLTRILMDAVAAHQPPKTGPFRPKPRYAHQGGMNPPLIVVHGSALDKISDSYKRYLEKTFIQAFKLQGTPLRVQFNVGKNPFADRKPAPLTPAEAKAAHRKRRQGRKMYGKQRKKD
ncbi:ribosome biogenesis GTPase Der [Sulfuriferula sp. AH1]|uniref:ribosome biogenesis GTPase Der n=1 Tax=Sulfuriferula sp. AH1 TaxID=1985873 RepID=UPI000B3B41CB|nr:ribosome biogenesis GTPase Der [Sulfuriferula sp. AH1]ARU32014.1 ribosome biogenesis GTPase Der [Sulfuriferula sp. AH1]